MVIWKINPSSGAVVSTYQPTIPPVIGSDIVFDATHNLIFYSTGTRIMKINADGTGETTCLNSGVPTEALLLDATNTYIFARFIGVDSDSYERFTLPNCTGQVDGNVFPYSVNSWTYDSSTSSLWVVDDVSPYLHKIRVSDMVEVATSFPATTVASVVYDSGQQVLWATVNTSNPKHLLKINPATGAILNTYDQPTNSAAYNLVYDTAGQRLWGLGGTNILYTKWDLYGYAAGGTFESQVLDTSGNVFLGTLSFTATTPSGTTLTVKARSSTQANMSGATAWTSCTAITSGQAMSTGNCVTNGHRYVQYLATLATSDSTNTSLLNDISLDYTNYTNGTLTSSAFDALDATNVLAGLSWTSSGTGTVKFQLRTSPDNATWTSWLGPTGAGDYYTDNTGSQAINSTNHDGVNDRYIQYKAFVQSADGLTTPSLTNVVMTYVVNAPPEFSGVPTATQSTDGTVAISYSVRDTDTSSDTGSVGVVTPSFEYSTDNGSHWSAITSGLPAAATTPKSIDGTNYTTFSTTWTAKAQLDGTYAAQAKVRVTVSDLQAANATATSSSTAFTLDLKSPTLGGTPVIVNAATTPATVTLSASDDSALQMCVTLDNTESNCVNYSSSTTIALATDPDTVYVVFKDAKGNTTSANAVTPQTPSNLVIRDISNVATNEYQLFTTWAASSLAVNQFGSYKVYTSTDGVTYNLINTITDKTINYYLHKGLAADASQYYKVTVTDASLNTSYYSTSIHGIADGQGAGTDLTPPSISSVTTSSLSTQSAVITWNTDELSNSTIGYSTTPATFTTEVGVATMVDTASGVGQHSVTLTELVPGTRYYFRVKSTDPSGNTTTETNGGDGFTFLTLDGPAIRNVTTTSVDNTSASISWQTNIAANSIVTYSTSGLLASPTTVTVSESVTNHSVALTGLTPGTQYHYSVTSGIGIDTNGGVYYTFTTTHDITGPVVSSISVAPITDTEAVVVWSTNEKATGQVAYGTSAGHYTLTSSVASSFNLDHAMTLTGLTPNTLYYYTITSADSSGNSTTSVEQTFTTLDRLLTATEAQALVDAAKNANSDTVAPTLTDISVVDLSATGANITWTSSESANSFVQFGATTSEQVIFGNWVYATDHTIPLLSLTPNTTYRYKVVSADLHGNLATSEQATFATPALPSSTLEQQLQGQVEAITQEAQNLPGPTIGGQPLAEVTASSATISWTTDKPANSLIAYATTAEYAPRQAYAQTVGDPEQFVTTHSVKIGNLSPDTEYHYQIRSTTSLQQTSTTTDTVFRTLKQAFVIDNYSISTPNTQSAIFRWTTTDTATATVKVTPYRNNVLAVDEQQQGLDETSSVIHQISIGTLEPSVRYQVELISVNKTGNRTSLTVPTFTTAATSQPPIITQIRVDSALSPGEKVKVQTIVSWNTDAPSTSRVFYRQGVGRPDEELPDSTTLDTNYTKHHVVVITSFAPGTVYQLRVESKDSNGQLSTSKALTTLTPQQQQTVFQVITNTFQQVFGWTQLLNR
jgi:hypothetical protein